MWNTILFDLDGTLTDSGEGIEKSAQYSLSRFGIQIQDPLALRHFVGPPLTESFRLYGIPESEMNHAIGWFRERYSAVGVYENKLYPGIRELLEFLRSRGYTLAVATTKVEDMAHEVLRYFGIEQYFKAVVGGTPDGSRFEKWDVINETLKVLGMENRRDEVLYIGDRKHDIIGARKSGIASVGVLYGYGSYQELTAEKPSAVINTVEDIGRWLTEIQPAPVNRAGTQFSQGGPLPEMQFREAPLPYRHPWTVSPCARNASIDGHEGVWMKIWRCLYPALIYFAIANIIAVIGLMILSVSYFAGGGSASAESMTDYLLGQTVLLTGIGAAAAIPLLAFFFLRDERRRSIYSFTKGILQDQEWKIPKILCSTIFCVAASDLISYLVDLTNLSSVDPAYQQVAQALSMPSVPVQIFAVVIFGPIAEELVFRGLIFRRLRDYLNPMWAILISGVAFGVYHGNLVQGIFAGLLGMLLALVYEKSGTIIVPIAAHMGNNLMSVLAGCFGIDTVSVFELVTAVILLAGTAWYLFFYKPFTNEENP